MGDKFNKLRSNAVLYYICSMSKKIELLGAAEAELKLTRLAYEIYEQNLEVNSLVLVGVEGGGQEIAKILMRKLDKICNLEVSYIVLKIDKKNPVEVSFEENFDPSGKTIILVDDVANSGKTLTYALKPFLYSVAKKIQTAVLIDRQHKRFPISSDYIGLQLSTTIENHITVEVAKGKVVGAFVE